MTLTEAAYNCAEINALIIPSILSNKNKNRKQQNYIMI